MTNIEYTHNGQTYTGAFDADAGWCLCDAEVQCDGCHDACCDHDDDCGGEHDGDCTCARQDLVRPHGERGSREYAYSHGGAQYRALIDAIERARHTTRTITVAIDSAARHAGSALLWGVVEGDDPDAAVADAAMWLAEGEPVRRSHRAEAEALDVVTIQWPAGERLPDGQNRRAIELALAALADDAREVRS